MSGKKKKRRKEKKYTSFIATLAIFFIIASIILTIGVIQSLQIESETKVGKDKKKLEKPDKDERNSFVSIWKTNKSGESDEDEIKLPLTPNGNYNFTIDWGDGKKEQITSFSDKKHSYDNPGKYKLNITGEIEGWSFDNEGDKNKIIEIKQWGELKLGNKGGHFHGAENLKITAEDSPNLEKTTNLEKMFASTKLNNISKISEWDVSNIENMNSMFSNAMHFNSNLNSWDTSKVKDMAHMFSGARSFNGSINKWNTSNVENMRAMFNSAFLFNQNIEQWDTSNVKDMAHMFNSAAKFNQSLESWDTSNVKDMKAMFTTAESFDQDLDKWNTSKVKDMRSMFVDAISFNGSITTWKTNNVKDMNFMFRRASSFEQDISGWNVSNVKTCTGFDEKAKKLKEEYKPQFEKC